MHPEKNASQFLLKQTNLIKVLNRSNELLLLHTTREMLIYLIAVIKVFTFVWIITKERCIFPPSFIWRTQRKSTFCVYFNNKTPIILFPIYAERLSFKYDAPLQMLDKRSRINKKTTIPLRKIPFRFQESHYVNMCKTSIVTIADIKHVKSVTVVSINYLLRLNNVYAAVNISKLCIERYLYGG